MNAKNQRTLPTLGDPRANTTPAALLCILGTLACDPGAADDPATNTALSAATDGAPTGHLSPGFHPSADGQYIAQSGFTTATAGANGVAVVTGDGALGVSIGAWGREESLVDLAPVTPVSAQRHDTAQAPFDRLEWRHDDLTEHWSIHRRGLEHGWDVHTPPPGDGPLVFELTLDGASRWSIDADGSAVTLTAEPRAVRQYTALKAWDADGVALDATFTRSDQTLYAIVDDTGATYPLTVDPLFVTDETILTASDARADAQFGYDVAIIGDVNADGYDDVAVGAPYDSDVADGAGAVYIYLGSASGVDDSTELILHASDGAEDDHFGWSVAGAGDVNGDGYADLIVGAPGVDTDDLTDVGAVVVYLGSADGIDAETEDAQTLSTWIDLARGGYSVSGAGDLNGDGYADVVVGAPSADFTIAGMAAWFLGSADGVDWTEEYQSTSGQAAYSYVSDVGYGSGKNDRLGRAVSAAGDVDGDGIEDLVVGAPFFLERTEYPWPLHTGQGRLHVKDAGGWTEMYAPDGTDSEYGYVGQFGTDVAAAGDVDGDGYDDLIVGIPEGSYESYGAATPGVAVLLAGGSSGISTGTGSSTLLHEPTAQSGDRFGAAVAGGGDINGDGYDDVVVGGYDVGTYGTASVFVGSAAGVSSADPTVLTAAAPVTGGQFGWSVSTGGDVNGDGYDEVIVGRPSDGTAATDAGSVVVFGGTCVSSWYVDADGDGHGTGDTAARYDCEALPGEVSNDDDCDDDDATASPSEPELCDDVDHDCDGTVDNGLTEYQWYRDRDGDGYPASGYSVLGCGPTGEYDIRDVDEFDCDDTDANVHPDAEEVCNHIDDDCDSTTDEQFVFWCVDSDNDGHGDPDGQIDCADTPGYAELCDDCDDDNPTVFPGADERCDGVDHDCDGVIEETYPPGSTLWHTDADGDGYTVPHIAIQACPPDGSLPPSEKEDCDDTDRHINPGATERPGDGIDQDCDGSSEDVDTAASCAGCATGPGEKNGWPLVTFALGLVGVAVRRRG